MRDAEAEEVKQASRAVWGASPAGWTFGRASEIGTREFFEAVMERRSTHEQPWLPEIVPFAEMSGKAVLEIGCGAGYDALTFMRNGSDYTGVDITPENPERVRRHLGHYGLKPKVLEADAEELPFESDRFDVVYANGVLHHTPRIDRALSEMLRVLRADGDLYASVYNRNSAFYLLSLGLGEQILKGGMFKRSMHERLAMVEGTTSEELPLVNVYSPRQFRAIVRSAGFEPVTTSVRKLVAEDLPSLPGLNLFWQRLPARWLDFAGRWVGWYVWAHGIKPA